MVKDEPDSPRVRMVGNTDPRALRTRARLIAAYRDLADESGHDAVTVARLVARAGVNRTSFYAHYASPDELAAEALTEFFEVLASSDSASRRGGDRTPAEVSLESLSEVVRFVVDRRKTYSALLRRSAGFACVVEDAFADSARRTLEAEPGGADPEVTARFIAAGVIGVLAWWLEGEHDWTPERLAEELTRIIPVDFTRSRPE